MARSSSRNRSPRRLDTREADMKAFILVGLLAVSAGAQVIVQRPEIIQPPPRPPAPPPPPPPPPVIVPTPPILLNYKPVDADRLKRPADDDWLMLRRTYDG